MALGPNRYGMSDERGYELDEFGNPVVSTKDGRVVADSDVNPPAETRSSGGNMFGGMFAGLDMRKALRGIYSGMGAAAQANQGWGGPGRAYGAGLLGGQAPSERDRMQEQQQEDALEKIQKYEDLRMERERRTWEREEEIVRRWEALQRDLFGQTADTPTPDIQSEAASQASSILAGLSSSESGYLLDEHGQPLQSRPDGRMEPADPPEERPRFSHLQGPRLK